jgi:hypothetical protein
MPVFALLDIFSFSFRYEGYLSINMPCVCGSKKYDKPSALIITPKASQVHSNFAEHVKIDIGHITPLATV